MATALGIPDINMDMHDETRSTSTSSSRSSTRQRPSDILLDDQESRLPHMNDVKEELERMQRRNSIVDSDSGRISPPTTKAEWETFIKRLVIR